MTKLIIRGCIEIEQVPFENMRLFRTLFGKRTLNLEHNEHQQHSLYKQIHFQDGACNPVVSGHV